MPFKTSSFHILFLFTFSFLNAFSQTKVKERFLIPSGYHLVPNAVGGFGEWLGNLPLKPQGSHTLTYTGRVSDLDSYTAAVLDISVDAKGLQQCADAIIRLRSEYLYSRKKYSSIQFHFTNGLLCSYNQFAKGYRFINSHWILREKADYSHSAFMKYNLLVFTYAGTLSLDKELSPIHSPDELKAGDVFIRPGSPGHCFLVLEVVENEKHQKRFLLAQSFIPAQNIQIIQENGNPWFSLETVHSIPYGEILNSKYLKGFE